MIKKILFAAVSLTVFVFGLSHTSRALSENSLYPEAKRCKDAIDTPIVNVTQNVINDLMLGEGGGNWAKQSFTRHLTIWKTAEAGVYCGTNELKGKFSAISNALSPGLKYSLTGSESGDFELFQLVHITSENFAPSRWAKEGFVGTYDYSQAYIDWIREYFPTYGVTNDWIGWKYTSDNGSSWERRNKVFYGDIKPAN